MNYNYIVHYVIYLLCVYTYNYAHTCICMMCVLVAVLYYNLLHHMKLIVNYYVQYSHTNHYNTLSTPHSKLHVDQQCIIVIMYLLNYSYTYVQSTLCTPNATAYIHNMC